MKAWSQGLIPLFFEWFAWKMGASVRFLGHMVSSDQKELVWIESKAFLSVPTSVSL